MTPLPVKMEENAGRRIICIDVNATVAGLDCIVTCPMSRARLLPYSKRLMLTICAAIPGHVGTLGILITAYASLVIQEVTVRSRWTNVLQIHARMELHARTT